MPTFVFIVQNIVELEPQTQLGNNGKLSDQGNYWTTEEDLKRLFFETIPPKVTINEYIELAKDYSTAQSGQFVNGILDSIHKDLVQEGKLQKTDFRKA